MVRHYHWGDYGILVKLSSGVGVTVFSVASRRPAESAKNAGLRAAGCWGAPNRGGAA